MTAGDLVRRALRWIGRHELGSVLSLTALALGIWIFAEIADEVGDGDADGVDEMLLLALRNPANLADPIGPEWLEEMGRDITALGGFTLLALLTTVLVGYLLLVHKSRAALLVLISVLGAVAVSYTLKDLFGRPRPALVPHLVVVHSASFPSGHAMLSAAVYLTLGALLARLQARLMVKAYVLLCALLLSFLVGLSRVYVGVHWPTDVLAGWAAGAAWAALCWIVARRLQRHGAVEPPTAAVAPAAQS